MALLFINELHKQHNICDSLILKMEVAYHLTNWPGAIWLSFIDLFGFSINYWNLS